MAPDPINPGRPARSRLVIPLDRQRQRPVVYSAGRAPRKRRATRILALLGVFILGLALCLIGGAVLWWKHYKTTPAYSLALLVDAAQRNDMDTVTKIVDTDKIVDNFAAQVVDKAASRYGVALSGAARKQIEALSPRVMPVVKQNVRDGVTARVKEISESASHKPFIVIALGLPHVVNIVNTGDTATASAVVKEQQVALDMQRSNDAWTVVGLHDEALVQRMIDEVIKELPAIGLGDDPKSAKHARKLLPPVP